MRDEEIIERFENITLESFHHADHVRLVWLYLRRYTLAEVLARFPEALKRFATAHGKPDLYHETITWAYIFLIHERALRGGETLWEEFARNNPDLLKWKDGILKSYYLDGTLQSETAKRVFVLPDRLAEGR